MIKVFAKSASDGEIEIYDPIGVDWFGDGVTAKKFRAELKELGAVKTITVRINSPGGEVFDGFAIYNALKEHAARKIVHVDGVAASIASVIAMAGDEIIMGAGAMMMIHDPFTIAIGNAEAMRKVATMLDGVAGGLVDAYAAKTGKSRAKLQAWMNAETWFNADEAVDNGFADRTSAADAEDLDAAAHAASSILGYRETFRAFAMSRVSTPRPEAAEITESASADATIEEVTAMENETASANAAGNQQAVEAAARQSVMAAERNRRTEIRSRFGRHAEAHRVLLDACLDDPTVTVESASAQLLAKLGEGQTPMRPAGTAVEIAADERAKFRDGASAALMARAGLGPRDPQNEFNGMSLSDLARSALERAGISCRGMTKDAIARKVLATHTTSDFPLLTAATAGKALIAAYREIPTTWQLWAKKGSVPDFKVNSRLSLGSFSNLLTIPEGSEYKQGTFTEEGNNLQALTKGRYIQLTRQLIVNDDLGAFVDRSAALGRAARRTVEADVYTSLTSASGAGPTMADTGALFNATAVTTAGGHANLTSSGTALSVASLNVGNLAMRAQKDVALNDYAGFRPKYLLVPPGKEYLAWELLNSVTDVAQANPAKRNFAQTFNLTVISSDYLSGNAWYLIADPSVAPLYEVAFLDGVEEPFIDEEVEFLTDALRMKVRLDYGLAPIEFRAGYRNAGA